MNEKERREPDADVLLELRRRTRELEGREAEQKKIKKLVRVQRDLSRKMLETEEPSELIKTAFRTILDATGLDSGGVYLADAKSGTLQLVYHQGLSKNFIREVSRYHQDSPHVKLVQKGKRFYIRYDDLQVPKTDAEKNEGLKAIAVVPIIYRGRVLGCVNVASHSVEEITEEAMKVIEAVVGQIGLVMSCWHMFSARRQNQENERGFGGSRSDVFLEMDEDFRFTTWSKDAEDLTEISARDALGKSFYEFFPNIAETKTEKKFLEAWRRQKPENFNVEYPLKGMNHTFEVSLSPSERRISVFVKDITERTKIEEALRKSEQRLKEAQALGRIGSWEFDLATQKIEWSDQVYELYERDKALGPPSLQEELLYYPPQEARRIREVGRLAIEKGEEFRYDLTAKLPSGRAVFLNASLRPIKDEKGRVIKLFGTVQDITERKKAEEALRESEEKYRNLVERANDGIAIIQDGLLKYVNSRALEIVGYGSSEIIDRFFTDFIHPDEVAKTVSYYNRRLKGERVPSKYESSIVDKNGRKIQVEFNASIILYQGRPADMAIVRDITEHKRAEEELRASREQLRQFAEHMQWIREEERTRIAREIHDELGQSLTALKMDLSFLSHKLPTDRKSLLEKTKSMSKLIDTSLQTVKRISSELRPGLLDDVGLSAAVEWQAEEFQKRTGIECKVTIEPEEITLDRERSTAIFRIFQETLTNIARHAQATRVKISLKEINGSLELRVRDNGKGIPEKKTTDPKSFGLMGIRERAHFLKGKVDIKGIRNKGTTISLKIPFAREEESDDKNTHRR